MEENVDWQLAEEDLGFITPGGGSPINMLDGTAYPLTEKQKKTWALIEDLDQKIKKRRRQLSRKEKFSENEKNRGSRFQICSTSVPQFLNQCGTRSHLN